MIPTFDIEDHTKLSTVAQYNLALPSQNSNQRKSNYTNNISDLIFNATASIIPNTNKIYDSKKGIGLTFNTKDKSKNMDINMDVTSKSLSAKDSTNQIEDEFTITLPNRDIICQLYILYTILMGMANLLMSHLQGYIAILLSPLFFTCVFMHSLSMQSTYNQVLGAIIIMLYPWVVYAQTYGVEALVPYFLLFVFYVVYKPIFKEKHSAVEYAITMLLISACIIGIGIYTIYPKSIHGLHASFLSVVVLTCYTLFLQNPFSITAHYQARVS
jgi:hypothetical protein